MQPRVNAEDGLNTSHPQLGILAPLPTDALVASTVSRVGRPHPPTACRFVADRWNRDRSPQ
jgi:hypothetical protein